MSTPVILSSGDIEMGPWPALDVADCKQDVALDGGKLLVGDLAELELHLRLEQAIPEGGVVVRLGLSRSDDLVEHEAEAPDQQGIEDEHHFNFAEL